MHHRLHLRQILEDVLDAHARPARLQLEAEPRFEGLEFALHLLIRSVAGFERSQRRVRA